MSDVTIDPKALRNDCLSFGLAESLLEKRLLDLEFSLEHARLIAVCLSAIILFGEDGYDNVFRDAYLGHTKRTFVLTDDSRKEFPAWGEGEESEIERLADAFFAPYANYFGKLSGMSVNDTMGPLLFFSGAIKEDIEEGRNKEEGDEMFDSFKPIIEKIPLKKEELLGMVISLQSLD